MPRNKELASEANIMNRNREHKLPQSLEAREMKFFGEQPSRVPKMEESRGRGAEGESKRGVLDTILCLEFSMVVEK